LTFAPEGERSIARAYQKVMRNARRLIYLEDQYIWSPQVVRPFAEALAARPDLRLIAVLPHHPDRDSRTYNAPQLYARAQVVDMLHSAGGDRVAFYGIENRAGVPVYVHAKVTIIDDTWCTVGSDNLNMRSWTYDTEISCAVLDGSGRGNAPARRLRLALCREHLERPDGDDHELDSPAGVFAAFAVSARRLQEWHDAGRQGCRPPGRLRPYAAPSLPGRTRFWSGPVYRRLYDPDGRPKALRRAATF